jgi:hypothetical protein
MGLVWTVVFLAALGAVLIYGQRIANTLASKAGI